MTVSSARLSSCRRWSADFGPEWVGVSVTMPGKFAALQFADERTERAELVGSANTLVRTDHGWRADNTDIDGVAGALGHHRHLRHAIVLGLRRHRTRRGRRPGRTGGHRDHRRRAQPRQGGPVARPRPRRRGHHPVLCAEPSGAPGRRRRRRRHGQHHPGRRRPPNTPTSSRPCRCCSTRSTTRGPRRWPPPSRAAGGEVISGAADAVAPGVQSGRTIHRPPGSAH